MTKNKFVIAYIGLGSNQDNPKQQLLTAINRIKELPGNELRKVSKFYRNPPFGYLQQPDFVNAVVEVNTQLSPQDLLAELLAIETLHKRIRSENRNGPRTLDLDILLYGNETIDLPQLTIPHPRIKERAFVIHPLADLNRELILPCGTPLHQLTQKIPATGLIEIDPVHIMITV